MLDLSTWNLTIPQRGPAATISTAKLGRDYESPYFRRSADGVEFWVPVNGAHTSGSEYPRTELRETRPDGRLVTWRYPLAENQMVATLRVEAVPSSRRMVIGQIHSNGSGSAEALPLVKLVYQQRLDKARVQALVRDRPDDITTRTYTVYDGIPLGDTFTYRLGVSSSGVLSVQVQDGQVSQQLDTKWAYQGLYFKAGLYLQDNRGPASEGGRATFTDLSIRHQ
ncbi:MULTISPECIES: polysaccharide lyase family 7 protein [Pseudomonas]|uniref:Polysaccharide lyase family 7 protein n=2 Tax=Pseudomonas nitroreducens/multiresinivorans group TaxID=627141 RepID=A0A6G6IUP7_PSENT|nr:MULTISPECIES: polysaccharide lyase family 7 protein [Pseudomonas]MBG6286978.1 polysaccharide lyase family 7 protein [Pseudomonas nitroreducens]MCE4069855.1 polysaccharide lyase family 7 protein [Pseudomonas nitritireducens]MCE4078460.1 polysaccharide lyase family 7 protein [Pseudomonas nitroreducens]MCJ1879408.1 polysaccharide lyase family 7 protein [Pseudomonas nitroreducens]MCJ1896703.1 polysaccharide lyase family 7 protein [Pseudomonas nitroreducens]